MKNRLKSTLLSSSAARRNGPLFQGLDLADFHADLQGQPEFPVLFRGLRKPLRSWSPAESRSENCYFASNRSAIISNAIAIPAITISTDQSGRLLGKPIRDCTNHTIAIRFTAVFSPSSMQRKYSAARCRNALRQIKNA